MAPNWLFSIGLCRSQKMLGSDQQTTAPAFAERYRSATWFILISVMIANFTDLFIYSAIVPVAPFALPARAGVPPDDIQYWVSIMLAVFNVFSIVTSLPCGWISDKLGVRRPMFIVGTLVQFAGLTLVTIGTSIPMWIAGRALQGTACAIVLTTTLPLLLESAPKNQSGRYLGIFAMSASAALVAGPLIGGVVYEKCGYIPVFAICFALNGLDFVMRSMIIEKKKKKNVSKAKESAIIEIADTEKGTATSPDDLPAQKSSTVITTTEVSDFDSDTASNLSLKSSGPGLLSYLRRRSVVFELLCSSRMVAALYGALLYTSIQTAFDATLPLFVSTTFGWDSLGGGLVFIPLLMSDFCGPVFGWLADKLGARLVCSVGFVLGVAPLVCLRFVQHGSVEQKVLLFALIGMVGLGMAAVLPAVMAEIGVVIEEKGLMGQDGPEDVGAVARAYGLFNIAYSGGCLIGPLWGGLVRESAGWPTMGWSLALFWASGLVPALLWLK